jgi:uncharacterized cupin superfamily protein
MTAKEPDVVRSVTTADDLAPDPMDPSWIIEGNPQARSRRLFLDPDRSISAILWDCTAGRFDWHYGGDEIIQIVDGEAELTFPSGTVTTVKPGDVVYFPSDRPQGPRQTLDVHRLIRVIARSERRTAPARRS